MLFERFRFFNVRMALWLFSIFVIDKTKQK